MMTALLLATTVAGAQNVELLLDIFVDGGNDFTWEEVSLPGSKCGNGSDYTFYVRDSPTSDNMLFYFEGGGGCWTYEGCTGANGVLGAANPNGLAPNYMEGLQQKYATPLVNGFDPGVPFRSRTELPTNNWDIVFMPYCTGDVHTGNAVTEYENPTDPNDKIDYYHYGAVNTFAAIDWVIDDGRFDNIDKLLVSGYSAGGAGTSATYYFLRTRLNPKQGFLLNDSGPLFPAPDVTFNSFELHDTITDAWGLETLFAMLPSTFDRNDYGTINTMVSLEFPDDQIAYTGYSSDYNYSRFSYESFDETLTQAETLDLWREDQSLLVQLLESDPRYDNVSWHVPWARPINDSHCSTIITFIGSHACEQMEKKRRWWEYLELPWGQSYKCYSEFVPMETFLERWIDDGEVSRIVEPPNGYNDEDPGMNIIAPLIESALSSI